MTHRTPTPPHRHLWDGVVLATTLAVSVATPLRLVSGADQSALPGLFEGLVTLLFFADLLVRYGPRRGEENRGQRQKAWIAVDVLAALPLGFIFQLPVLGLLRLIKLLHLFSVTHRLSRSALVHPTVLRLSVFAFWLTISTHWLTCGWMALGGARSTPSGGPYLDALYWSVTTLTTVGYGDVTPQTPPQTLYAMFVMISGVAVYGFVIGNVATLLTRMDLAKAQYVATLERLSGFLRYHRVPAPLQRHIFDYHKYLWERRLGYDETSVLDGLPLSLRREVSLVLQGEFIEKVSFLEGASRDLVRDLCAELQPAVFTPGDDIVRRGEPGRHMYFINSGIVEVLGEDDETVIHTFSDGELFGEIALLHTQPRTATVRAVGYCDLHSLDHDAFVRTVSAYPDFAAHIARISEERTGPGRGGAPDA